MTTIDDSLTRSDATVDATGDGVTRYPVFIDNRGSLRVDINLTSQDQQEGQ